MKIGNHLPHARYTSGHAANHVMLVPVIDAHIRIRRPDQHRINAAISLFEIVEISIHRIFVGYRIVKIAVFHHHLWLNKTGLGPLERGHVVP